MTLTTPVPRDIDSAFPGENWFYYWKTSSSLWRAKLESSPQSGPVIVPLNWSFHTETGDTYDFASNRPETNLKRLTDTVESLGRRVIFFLPLTPAPFLPNGGVPHLLARVVSLDESKVSRAALNCDGGLNKIFSFFDPRIFQAYSKFVKELGSYFTREGIASDVYGIDCGFLSSKGFKSFLYDESKSFEQSFSRFLTAKKNESNHDFILTPEIESDLKEEFFRTIRNLYVGVAREGLCGNWEGEEKVCFLGSHRNAYFSRLLGADISKDYSMELFSILVRDLIPSSALLSARTKKGVLKHQLNDLIDQSFIERRLGGQVFDDDLSTKFRTLCFFELHEGRDGDVKGLPWSELGVIESIKNKFLWSYLLHQGQDFEWSDELLERESIHFFRGEDVDGARFNQILKLFMSGGQGVLDKVLLSDNLRKKLEVFFIENSIKVEKVNLSIPIEYASLGPGKLIVVDTSDLRELDYSRRVSFWDKLVDTFNILALKLKDPEGIEVAWRTRGSTPSELNFQEVRRLSLYNPSSYRKRFKILLEKHFVLTRVVNESQVKIHSTGHEVEIEFMPEGSVSIDLGVFS